MKIKNPFKALTKFEFALWLSSVAAVIISFLISPQNPLSFIASLIGATALIFVAKGYVLGQILTVVFAVFYGIISFELRYYGEMITYLFMTSPIAIMAVVSWIKNPFEQSNEVKVNRMSKRQLFFMALLTAAVTFVFYFILKALGNANLWLSTVSVTTSFSASYLTFMRSPFYAVAYAANDIVLIALWVLAAIKDISYLPMIICFVLFLVNDIYGFVNWQRMQKRQEASAATP